MHVTCLVGGKGTRLKAGMPKCLVDVGGKPFIEHKLSQLWGFGASSISLMVGPYATDFAYLDLPMIEDAQQGVMNCVFQMPPGWWTMGDVLLRDHPIIEDLGESWMFVTKKDGGNIAGIYEDCGLYSGTGLFKMAKLDLPPLTINTPADLEETRAYLG